MHCQNVVPMRFPLWNGDWLWLTSAPSVDHWEGEPCWPFGGTGSLWTRPGTLWWWVNTGVRWRQPRSQNWPVGSRIRNKSIMWITQGSIHVGHHYNRLWSFPLQDFKIKEMIFWSIGNRVNMIASLFLIKRGRLE